MSRRRPTTIEVIVEPSTAELLTVDTEAQYDSEPEVDPVQTPSPQPAPERRSIFRFFSALFSTEVSAEEHFRQFDSTYALEQQWFESSAARSAQTTPPESPCIKVVHAHDDEETEVYFEVEVTPRSAEDYELIESFESYAYVENKAPTESAAGVDVKDTQRVYVPIGSAIAAFAKRLRPPTGAAHAGHSPDLDPPGCETHTVVSREVYAAYKEMRRLSNALATKFADISKLRGGDQRITSEVEKCLQLLNEMLPSVNSNKAEV